MSDGGERLLAAAIRPDARGVGAGQQAASPNRAHGRWYAACLVGRREETAMTRSSLTVAFIGVLASCTDYGGAPEGGADAGPALAACAEAMAAAPLAPADYPATDALPRASRNTWDGQTIPEASDASYPGGRYRTIEPDAMGQRHPGCSIGGLSYAPASIPGFVCAAKQYPFPSGVSEDPAKPIVVLVHGNSDVPASWEKFLHPDPASLEFPADMAMREQLAERLPALGYRTIAVDLRFDLVDDPADPGGEPTSPVGNTPKNMDHGWATPLAQELIKRVIEANPDRELAIVGLSLGVTVARDALRRLYVEYRTGAWDRNPFEQVRDVVLGSGGNHGVSTYAAYCGSNTTMRGIAACQFGQRNTYTQVPFHRPLNGPPMPTEAGEFGGWYETPCADGDYAFGERGACGGHAVRYTTITMRDLEDGTQQDPFVSEHSSRLYPTACARNVITELSDFDTSGYFLNGFFRNHYGSVRSEAGIRHVLDALAE
jgi:hypothetical protein